MAPPAQAAAAIRQFVHSERLLTGHKKRNSETWRSPRPYPLPLFGLSSPDAGRQGGVQTACCWPSLVRRKIVTSLGDAGIGVNGTEDKTHRVACRSSTVDSTMCRYR